jgi:hypothetical protein
MARSGVEQRLAHAAQWRPLVAARAVEGIRRLAAAQEPGEDLGAAVPRLVGILEHQGRRTLGHHEAVAVLGEGLGRI